MGEIVNLRRVRKAKARADAAEQAATNRAKNGQTQAERKSAEQERDKSNRILDGAQIGRPSPIIPDKS